MSGPVQRVGLTARQRACFEAIETYVEQFKRSPSLEEIAKMMNLTSKSGIYRLLQGLQERGWITMIPKRARSVAIVPDANAAGFTLPAGIDAKLRAHCAATGEDPADVLADAVTLFFDEAEGSVAA